jgi:hypothetical protein
MGRSMLMLGIAESADQGDKLAGKPCPTVFFILTRKATANLIEVFSVLKNGGGMGMTAPDGSGMKKIDNNLQYVTNSDSVCQTS